MSQISTWDVELHTSGLIEALGFNSKDPNFLETSKRVARMWKAFREIPYPNLTSFPLEGKGGMILIKDHITHSFCPHHLLPVEYKCKIGYVPEKDVLGLSKLARIADYCVSDLPLQEDVAERIGKMLEDAIKPKGVGVIIEGVHMCMRMRGVESPCSKAVSTYMSGIFLDTTKYHTREEFMNL